MVIKWVINQITVKDVDRQLIGAEMYKNISLEEMLKKEVKGILTNYEDGGTDYYYRNGEGEFHEITELDLLRGRFYIEDGDFSEFKWELEESHIYISQ